MLCMYSILDCYIPSTKDLAHLKKIQKTTSRRFQNQEIEIIINKKGFQLSNIVLCI